MKNGVSGKNILKVEDLGVRFDATDVLQDITFSVEKGEVLAIIGPNGSGKSVLFKALLNLLPHSGKVHWNEGLKVSYIPQRMAISNDLPLSVSEFLRFKEKDQKKTLAALAAVGLTDEHLIKKHLFQQRIGALSGGELQRVLIAWSLLDNPDVILYDEPTSGIDVGGEETIYNLIKKLHDKKGFTILIISHDLNIVYKYASKVICINKKMVCHGIPNETLDPHGLAELYGGHAGFHQHNNPKEDTST
jgi:zinc transport system ATP-binding protein